MKAHLNEQAPTAQRQSAALNDSFRSLPSVARAQSEDSEEPQANAALQQPVQGKIFAQVDRSPRQLAQRRRMDSAFGTAVQSQPTSPQGDLTAQQDEKPALQLRNDTGLGNEAESKGEQASLGPALMVIETRPGPNSSPSTQVVQGKIKPSRKLSQYLSDYGSASKKEKTALEGLFTKLIESAFVYEEDGIHDAIRRKGLHPEKLEALYQELQANQSEDADEALGGARAHGVSRHYAISDKDLDARLRGPGAIAKASRFASSEGTRVLKLHNLIKAALTKYLSAPAKQLAETVHATMHDPTDPYAALNSNALRKTHLQGIVALFNEVIDEGDPDGGFAFSIDPKWKVQVANAPAVVTLTCEFEVESVDDFEKDEWTLDGGGKLQKGTAQETAKMFAGSNAPTIVITTGDSLAAVTAQTKGIIEKSGVTLF